MFCIKYRGSHRPKQTAWTDADQFAIIILCWLFRMRGEPVRSPYGQVVQWQNHTSPIKSRQDVTEVRLLP